MRVAELRDASLSSELRFGASLKLRVVAGV